MAETNLGRVAIVPQGTYSASIQYYYLDLVYYQGSSYLVHTQPTIGTLPTDTNYFYLAAEGAEVEMRYDSITDYIQWKLITDVTWNNLIQPADFTPTIVQGIGLSETDVMSQKAVTDELLNIKEAGASIPIFEYGILDSNGVLSGSSSYSATDFSSYELLTSITIASGYKIVICIYDKDKTTGSANLLARISEITGIWNALPISGAKFFRIYVYSETTVTPVIAASVINFSYDNKLYADKYFKNSGIIATFEKGLLNSSGVEDDTTGYCRSNFMQLGMLAKIYVPAQYTTVGIRYYDKDKIFKASGLFTTSPYIPDDNVEYSYIRIFVNETIANNATFSIIFEMGDKSSLNTKVMALPLKLYMLSDVENDLFFSAFVKNKGIDDIVRVTPNAGSVDNYQESVKVQNPSEISSLNFQLYATEPSGEIVNVDEKDVTLVNCNKTVDTGEIKVNLIGDSFTAMSGMVSGIDENPYYQYGLLEQNYCPNIKLVGMRKNYDYPTQCDDGRGGWSLADYFSVHNTLSNGGHAGFWQPSGAQKFWGMTTFWKNAIVETNFYEFGRYDKYTSLFNASTGYLITPSTDDIMYDGTTGKYMIYNGSSWVETTYAAYSWEWSYSKYLSMWNIETPDICCVMLGMNDFRGSWSGWSVWEARMDLVIASFKVANPNGAFIIAIHCTDIGGLNNDRNEFSVMQNINLWKYREAVINKYDGREEDGIYLVDCGIMVDGKYGYPTTEVLPFSTYSGTERIKAQTLIPHPTLSYPAMSLPLAAAIQYIRSI